MEVKTGYKQTEVGVIPEDWEVKTLNNLSTISRLAGAEYTSLWEETPNGEIIALRGFNIGQGKIIERDFVRISNRLSLKLKRSRLCKGDVVYPCVGSIGNAVVIAEDAKYHIQQNIARITPNPAAIDSDYLANYLMSSLAEREVERFTSSSSQPSVLVGSLRQYRVPLPSNLPEQRAIAAALSDVDGLLGGLDRLIAKKRDLKQAAMQQLLTGQTRLPGFHGEWINNPLRSFVRQFTVPMRDKPPSLKGDIPWCRIEDFDGMYLADSKSGQGVTVETIRAMNLKVYPVGTLLVSCSADLGRCAVVARPLVSNQTFIGLEMDDEAASNLFFYYLMSSKAEELNNLSSGTTISYLPREKFEEFQVLAPLDKEEQTAIATVLSEMDGELAVLEQRREKTRALKQAMMQELLTGRTRLV